MAHTGATRERVNNANKGKFHDESTSKKLLSVTQDQNRSRNAQGIDGTFDIVGTVQPDAFLKGQCCDNDPLQHPAFQDLARRSG